VEKILDSGAVLNLTMCSFAEGNRLMKAVARELKATSINLGFQGKDLKDLFKLQVGDETLNTIKNLVTGLLASDEIEAALWPCIERGTYNGVHIKRDIFEDEKVRTDYIAVLKEALIFNLTPFSSGLVSLLRDIPKAGTATRQ
jgi:hypothetical protein